MIFIEFICLSFAIIALGFCVFILRRKVERLEKNLKEQVMAFQDHSVLFYKHIELYHTKKSSPPIRYPEGVPHK